MLLEDKLFRIGFVTLLILSIGIGVVVILWNMQKKSSVVPISVTSPSPEPTSSVLENTASVRGARGIFTVQIDTVKRYTVGSTIDVYVYANSQDEIVKGFDVVLLYSPSVSLVRTEGLLSNFDYLNYVKDQTIYVTGAQKLRINDVSVLKNEAIVKYTFTALTKGIASFKILHRQGLITDSNMTGSQNIDLLSTVTNAQITIE
ncbi:MAG: hypothetical protein UZ21_OP11001000379 [Microgenomates bacterium OLB22]|nr:MAG: hypothetical protein UZ21_OP11001000379 [Microgenomates bacterium OLB22]